MAPKHHTPQNSPQSTDHPVDNSQPVEMVDKVGVIVDDESLTAGMVAKSIGRVGSVFCGELACHGRGLGTSDAVKSGVAPDTESLYSRAGLAAHELSQVTPGTPDGSGARKAHRSSSPFETAFGATGDCESAADSGSPIALAGCPSGLACVAIAATGDPGDKKLS
jgi:hypothetical protein